MLPLQFSHLLKCFLLEINYKWGVYSNPLPLGIRLQATDFQTELKSCFKVHTMKLTLSHPFDLLFYFLCLITAISTVDCAHCTSLASAVLVSSQHLLFQKNNVREPVFLGSFLGPWLTIRAFFPFNIVSFLGIINGNLHTIYYNFTYGHYWT